MVSVSGVPGFALARRTANRCRGASRRSAAAPAPGWPRSSASRAFSIPALPFSSKSTTPSTCAASVPFGIVALALVSGCRSTPGCRLRRFCASSGVILRLTHRKPRWLSARQLHLAVQLRAVQVQHQRQKFGGHAEVRHLAAGRCRPIRWARSSPAAGRCGRRWCRAARGSRPPVPGAPRQLRHTPGDAPPAGKRFCRKMAAPQSRTIPASHVRRRSTMPRCVTRSRLPVPLLHHRHRAVGLGRPGGPPGPEDGATRFCPWASFSSRSGLSSSASCSSRVRRSSSNWRSSRAALPACSPPACWPTLGTSTPVSSASSTAGRSDGATSTRRALADRPRAPGASCRSSCSRRTRLPAGARAIGTGPAPRLAGRTRPARPVSLGPSEKCWHRRHGLRSLSSTSSAYRSLRSRL